ncbi:MAG: DNA recombination protein RmuC [Phycisphaerales bacterium]
MDAMHIVLGLVALAGVGGVMWLLVQRGALAARVAGAEATASAAADARAVVVRELESERVKMQALDARADMAEKEAAALGAQLEAVESGRKRDRVDADERVEEAVRSARAVAAQELDKERSLRAKEREAVEQTQREIAAALESYKAQLAEKFDALAGRALKNAGDEFVKRVDQSFAQRHGEAKVELDKRREEVDQLVKPIAETLKQTKEALASMGKEQTGAYSGLAELMRSTREGGEQLRMETSKLVKALREPHVRGRYGEVQLKRVAELAGMTEYCDFATQDSTRDGDGTLKRPDMVVRMPSGRTLVVDAKMNIQAYMDAFEAETPELAEACLERFARHVSEQAAALGKKSYWADQEGSPEFTVMFIAGDQFLDAALSRRPDLLDHAAENRVILATPSTLIALLRAVAVGFREAKLASDAKQLLKLGSTLHERACVAMEHVAALGKSLNQAVGRYNDFVGSYETRLEPTLKQFEEAGVKGAKELPTVTTVEVRPRAVAAAGLFGSGHLSPKPLNPVTNETIETSTEDQ